MIRTADGRLGFGSVSTEHRTADPDSANEAPYLEDFFAFWDSVYQPHTAALTWNSISDLSPPSIHLRRYYLRQLRDKAIRSTYELLDPSKHGLGEYLSPLLGAAGPDGFPVIATLNFDLVIEQLAQQENSGLRDGFERVPDLPPPASWFPPQSDAWQDLFATDGIDVFVGFDMPAQTSEGRPELLKIHGSLGWVRIEEGEADLGWSELLRQNIHHATFRFTPERILAGGEDIHTFAGNAGFSCDSGRRLTGKMGAIWFRPDLVFAQARKVVPGTAMDSCLRRFQHWLRLARRLNVVGYGWRDPHINDLVLAQAADGLEVLNVGRKTLPDGLVELIVSKFPSTHRRILGRFFCVGGGAEAFFGNNTGLDFNGATEQFDFPEITMGDIPAHLNLGQFVESQSTDNGIHWVRGVSRDPERE